MNRFIGTVRTGLGDTSRQLVYYHDRVAKVLGYTPYPGSLNLKLNKPRKKPQTTSRVYTERFGVYHFYPCTIEGVAAHIMIPPGWKGKDKPNVAEIVCAKNLRQTLNLKDGDRVHLSIP